ncbi:pentatricopeptide repeat-containing protein At3g54980, mitochondrial [Cryptomeria japonica]|uniref:pentatricopeptide repeat-containing protein At3g54980, mitochondrial n=1 Tax=Cryptomeria japonica TaxID=3369 RepID=UPI0027D9E11C|nr:pentatricopeptide repeat-containing protein At3g54980, mitochondrial [Cryptomeria japonica]
MEVKTKGINPLFKEVISTHSKKQYSTSSRHITHKFNVVHFTQSIYVLCKSGNTIKVWDLFRLALTKRLHPDAISLTPLLWGFGNDGDLCIIICSPAELKEMEVHPNVIIYNTLTKALCKCDKIEEGHGLLHKMMYAHCFGGIVTYNLIDGICKFGMINEAFVLIAEVIQDDLSTSTVTYSTLIDGLCKLGKEGAIQRLVAKFYTYTSLIDGFFKTGKTDKVYNLFVQMMEFGPLPDEVTFTAVIDGLCKDGRMDKAWDCFHDMLKNGVHAVEKGSKVV